MPSFLLPYTGGETVLHHWITNVIFFWNVCMLYGFNEELGERASLYTWNVYHRKGSLKNVFVIICHNLKFRTLIFVK